MTEDGREKFRGREKEKAPDLQKREALGTSRSSATLPDLSETPKDVSYSKRYKLED